MDNNIEVQQDKFLKNHKVHCASGNLSSGVFLHLTVCKAEAIKLTCHAF
jgi:hypothetical protein